MADKAYTFEKLTPVDDADISVYENAINYVFENDDVKNVAISGAYGAGKSSLLASYKKKHSDRNFIHISLAHFKSFHDNDPTLDENSTVEMADLEGKILNQLIHQIPPKNIQQTHFKIKRTTNGKTIFGQTVAIVILILALLHVVLWSDWRSFVELLDNNLFKTIISLTTSRYSRFVSGAIALGLSSWFVYCIVKMQTNKNLLKKLNLQGTEIEIFENNDDSYFDKYLNEVLYLFENASADVIVFEDMDRFETSNIFERLREINTLANIQLKKDYKKPIRFFYLLRDDIFVSKDRTKFFDFIIPVVPVVDSSNSYNQFINLLKKNCLFDKFDENFLQGLSLYIDDMRLLINICNEFLVYINRLNITELDYNKMIAIITYKNLFPRDFSELQINRGFIYSLFSNKDKLIETAKSELELKISEKGNEIKNAKNEALESVQELDDIYAAKKSRTSNRYYNNYSQRQEYEKNLNEWYNNEYPKRKQAVENKINNKISSLEMELQALQSQLLSLKNRKLSEIITRENIDDIFRLTTINEVGKEEKYLDIKGNPYFALLKYLVRNGYIDESYPDYMTYFYENNLTRTDKIFLRSVTDRRAREYNYQLDKPEMVVARLKVADFDQEETLNFSLLRHLLKTDVQSEMVVHFMYQLKEKHNFDFIARYIEYGQTLSEFVTALYAQWIEVLSVIINKNTLSIDFTKYFLLLTLYYASNETIINANIDNCLTDYISNDEEFLNIKQPNIQKLINGFKLLNVRFIRIDYDVSDKEFFTAIYQNSLYELNYNNLSVMLQYMYGIDDESNIRHQNYSLIRLQSDSPLYCMIEGNMSEYVDVILDSCEKVIDDNEDTILALLNNAEVSIEQKQRYIGYISRSISLLSQIEDSSLWGTVINKNKLEFSEINILEYYAEFKSVDQQLIDYINKANDNIDMSDIPEMFKEIKPNFFTAIVKCEVINNTAYRQILNSLNQFYTSFSIKDISCEKINILIDIDSIRMNKESLEFIRENYTTEVLLYYILHGIEKYVDIIDPEIFSQEELVMLLSESISDDIKLKLLSFTNGPISIIDSNYSDSVKLYILNNNLNKNDIVTLYKNYETHSKEIQKFIFEYAERDYRTIINHINNVSTDLKNQLLESSLSLEKKIEIFIAMADNSSCEQAIAMLNKIGLPAYGKIFLPHHRPKFEVDNINKQLLNLFVKNKWIDSFEVDATNTEYYKVKKKMFTTK